MAVPNAIEWALSSSIKIERSSIRGLYFQAGFGGDISLFQQALSMSLFQSGASLEMGPRFYLIGVIGLFYRSEPGKIPLLYEMFG